MSREANYSIEPIFLNRWSPRAMNGEVVSEDIMMRLFEAARWAPSAGNTQPWVFVYARSDSGEFGGFVDVLVESNRVWAHRAGALIIAASRTTRINEKGEVKPLGTHAFDTGAAWMSLALQGHALGLVVHGMGGFDSAKARAVARLPDDIEIHCMIAVGHRGDINLLPAHLQAREAPNARNPVSDFVFEHKFQAGSR